MGFQRRFRSMEGRDWILEMCNRVWREEGWLEDCNEGAVVSILKKGEGRKMEDYGGECR